MKWTWIIMLAIVVVWLIQPDKVQKWTDGSVKIMETQGFKALTIMGLLGLWMIVEAIKKIYPPVSTTTTEKKEDKK